MKKRGYEAVKHQGLSGTPHKRACKKMTNRRLRRLGKYDLDNPPPVKQRWGYGT